MLTSRALMSFVLCLLASSSTLASTRVNTLYQSAAAPKLDAFTAWGPETNGLEVSISGPSTGTFDTAKYVVALRNVSTTPIFLCGLPWQWVLLIDAYGITLPPDASPSRSVYSPFTDTIEIKPNEAWIIPDGSALKGSYSKLPTDAAAVISKLEVSTGRRKFSSCNHAAFMVLTSQALAIRLE